MPTWVHQHAVYMCIRTKTQIRRHTPSNKITFLCLSTKVNEDVETVVIAAAAVRSWQCRAIVVVATRLRDSPVTAAADMLPPHVLSCIFKNILGQI